MEIVTTIAPLALGIIMLSLGLGLVLDDFKHTSSDTYFSASMSNSINQYTIARIPLVDTQFSFHPVRSMATYTIPRYYHGPVDMDNFQIQLLLSLIQPKDSMTAGDSNSHQLLKLSKKVSEADVTVFINGPTGTGKEVLSRFIHKNSRRSEKPFVGINCAAIPENMLEAILFGHEKGAFTGATDRRIGRFESAIGGTLFLDEIGEIDASTQVKLLRFLESKTSHSVLGIRHQGNTSQHPVHRIGHGVFEVYSSATTHHGRQSAWRRAQSRLPPDGRRPPERWANPRSRVPRRPQGGTALPRST